MEVRRDCTIQNRCRRGRAVQYRTGAGGAGQGGAVQYRTGAGGAGQYRTGQEVQYNTGQVQEGQGRAGRGSTVQDRSGGTVQYRTGAGDDIPNPNRIFRQTGTLMNGWVDNPRFWNFLLFSIKRNCIKKFPENAERLPEDGGR